MARPLPRLGVAGIGARRRASGRGNAGRRLCRASRSNTLAHRGCSPHTHCMPKLFALAGQTWTLGLWFGWGYLSHLLADLTTPMRYPALLWPWREDDLDSWRWGKPEPLPPRPPAMREESPPGRSISGHADGQSEIVPSEGDQGNRGLPRRANPNTRNQRACPNLK